MKKNVNKKTGKIEDINQHKIKDLPNCCGGCKNGKEGNCSNINNYNYKEIIAKIEIAISK